MTVKMIAAAATVKGVIMSLILLTVANVNFLQGLVTAILSATVSGCFLLVSVHLTTKRTEKKIDEAKTEIVEKTAEAVTEAQDGAST